MEYKERFFLMIELHFWKNTESVIESISLDGWFGLNLLFGNTLLRQHYFNTMCPYLTWSASCASYCQKSWFSVPMSRAWNKALFPGIKSNFPPFPMYFYMSKVKISLQIVRFPTNLVTRLPFFPAMPMIQKGNSIRVNFPYD